MKALARILMSFEIRSEDKRLLMRHWPVPEEQIHSRLEAPMANVLLPIRAVLYTFSDDSFWLIGVQVLDGVGAGIFGALTPLVIADIMRGTGRYNLAQDAIATMQGIGASLSGLAAGEIADHFGYSPAFLILGGAALVALIVFALQMPETVERRQAPRRRH
jgi:MFS family permease